MKSFLLLMALIQQPDTNWYKPTWIDYSMVTVSSALIIADWNLTMDGLSQGRRETNPILGEHPSKAHANLLIGLGLLANVAVLKIKDPIARHVIWAGVIFLEADAVVGNLKADLHFSF